ncbi:MAG: endonuclease III [Chloroflexi bacterium]|nr:endonuclease III [Chloroflexota bacterium]
MVRSGPIQAEEQASKADSYTATEVLTALEREYGPIQWRPRYEPVAELVFTILSQHTSDANAGRAFHQLEQAFGSWEAVMKADVDDVAAAIWTAGLARQKAPRLQGALRQIKALRGELDLAFLRRLPLAEAKGWLRQLKGVGPKTAAVVLCFSLGMPAMPVDTHVHRVARRLGLIEGRVSAEQAHDLLEAQVAPEQVFPFHVHLITHGRQVCKAQRPRCEACVLEPRCPSSRLRQPEGSPPGR